ncbi:hypothetical protein [uncultured Roseobacter sp.]|uniref:hypothetical protein n=1 Tax=uncultured Roseobacter sp. TaxID=114847 RepID=UPI002615DC13|nr:hypothetical protein [uncultured Roseobacter sp.]
MTNKPILCLDFDGVIHSYTSGWQGADVVADPPVPGAIEFICDAISLFDVHIFSSRSNQPGGIEGMQEWLAEALAKYFDDAPADFENFAREAITWPTSKPPAMVTIDDRAITFTGEFPDPQSLLDFKPWNKRG